MRRGRRAGIAVAFAIAAVALSVTGCGGGSGSSSSALQLDPVSAAATKTAKSGGARVDFAFSMSSPELAGGKAIALRGHGIMDDGSADLSIDMGSLFSKLGAPSSMPSTLREISLEEDGDYVFYLSFGGVPVLGGKPWIRVDLTHAYKKFGLNLSDLASPGAMDPSQLLTMLEGVGTVQTVGSATIGGVATTHYRATIDFAKLLQEKAAGSPAFQALVSSTGLKTVPADVWIDGKGLLRRLAMTFSLHVDGGSLRMQMAESLSDYAINASVTAPPSSDVYDATSTFLNGLNGFGSAFH
jgi:hypothetical protein